MNVGKTKVMVAEEQVKAEAVAAKHPCCVCNKGVGMNSSLCVKCTKWVHKKCSDV